MPHRRTLRLRVRRYGILAAAPLERAGPADGWGVSLAPGTVRDPTLVNVSHCVISPSVPFVKQTGTSDRR